MEDAAGVTTYAYDAVNRFVSRTDPNGFTVGSAYDEGGNLIQITYPGNHTVSYTYDALNRIKTVTIDWLSKTAVYNYDDAGRMTDLTHFNGTVVQYGYDEANRLTSLENLTAAGGAGIATYYYTLDGNGNRTRIVLGAPALNDLDSLVSAYTYNNRRNRLLGAGSLTFTYDDEGQIASGSAAVRTDSTMSIAW
jgi:YD repeat-containing protein